VDEDTDDDGNADEDPDIIDEVEEGDSLDVTDLDVY